MVKGEKVLWSGSGAQENRPDIPVGAITHQRGTGATHTGVCVVHIVSVLCGKEVHSVRCVVHTVVW